MLFDENIIQEIFLNFDLQRIFDIYRIILLCFCSFVQSSSSISDSPVEPQPLWEYPCQALSQPFCILDFNFTKMIEEPVKTEGKVNCEGSVFVC
jgi:hypothetical protein